MRISGGRRLVRTPACVDFPDGGCAGRVERVDDASGVSGCVPEGVADALKAERDVGGFGSLDCGA